MGSGKGCSSHDREDEKDCGLANRVSIEKNLRLGWESTGARAGKPERSEKPGVKEKHRREHEGS